MSEHNSSQEQLRYSTILYWGSRSGLTISVIAFLAYVFGLLPAYVPVEQLPNLWHLPVKAYLAATHTPIGWNWLGLAGHGDFASLIGIAWLSSCSLLCLLAIIPIYNARRDRVFATICIVEIAVLLLAASGILTAHH